MYSRGPLALLIVALCILVVGALAHSPQTAPALQAYAHQPWAFALFCALTGTSSVLLAWSWHRSIARARQFGKQARQRELEQRNIAQQRLIERQQWHRSLFEGNSLVMMLLDPETTQIVDANRAAETFYGYGRDTLLNMSICDINMLPPDSVREKMHEIRTQGTRRFDFNHRCADGSIRPVNVTSGPLLSGGRQLLFSIVQDMTAQLQAEESVRRIVEASPLGFHMYRLNGNQLIFSGYNRAADEILHVSHEAFIGKEIEDIFGSAEMKPVAACYREIARDGGQWSFENFHYAGMPSGGTFDVTAFQVSPGNMVAMFVDATERYRQEDLLARSEHRFRMLYERSPVGIAAIELPSLHIISANPAFQLILGYDERGLQNRPFDSLPVPDADDSVQLGPESFRVDSARTLQRRYLRRDGGDVWVQLTLCAIPGEQEGLRMGLAIVQDITQRRRAEEQLLHAKQAAEQASAAKDQFLAALSHELRTPLTPVLLTTQSMQMEPALSDNMREELATIQRNVELEARLIDDLLDLTRIARGKLQLHTIRMNIHESIRYATEICRPEAEAKGIRLETWLEAQRSTVFADASRMQQVFWNLIKNAIKFTPQRGLVVVRTRNDRDVTGPDDCPNIVCEIVDNGVGMDAEILSRVFRPFEQGSARITKLFGGLGMGLSITRAIIELHHGTIDAYSMGAGTGSIFTVTLGTAPQAGVAEPPREPEVPAPYQPLTVLLVEDHEATARVLTRLLIRCGYQVINASDVASGAKAAEGNSFDLLISDLGLPDGNGLDLVRQIKKSRNVPAIAVSGYGMEQDIRNSLAAGFQEHLTKPVNVDRLRQAITRVTTKTIAV